MSIYVEKELTGSFVEMANCLEGPKKFSHVLVLDPEAGEASHASEAGHARSEATRLVTVNCTQHKANTAHNTD